MESLESSSKEINNLDENNQVIITSEVIIDVKELVLNNNQQDYIARSKENLEISAITQSLETEFSNDNFKEENSKKNLFQNSESSNHKHILHVICFLLYLIITEAITICFKIFENSTKSKDIVDLTQKYGILSTVLLYLLRCLIFLPLPLSICHFFGLILFNAFPDKNSLKGSILLVPLISIRVVTRGNYRDLVKNNLERNMKTCLDIGLNKFIFEVITDKPLNLETNSHIREIVVPLEYKTKTQAKFKARALQYALEEEINVLSDEDWIVHLDEETLLTESALNGILNFIFESKHHIGQGMITYANEYVYNWFTTLADSYRVGVDLGSFVVAQVGVERQVTFDNGPEGSIAEDTYFAMLATSKGYSFNWIEGEMWEKSPYSVMDFLHQRKRWLQGIFLIVHDRKLPLKSRFCLAFALYAWLTLPLSTINIFLSIFFPLRGILTFDILATFVGAVNLYLYFIGAIKSFKNRFNYLKIILCILGSLCTLPFVIVIENIAVIWGIISKKNKFYIVQK